MKLEDMSREQLVALVKTQWKDIDNLRLQAKTAWDRYENSNRMAKSYMDEFESRGLVYIPKVK